MSIMLNDNQILQLIKEEKVLSKEFDSLFNMKAKKGHREQELTIKRDDGSLFKIIVRQNRKNALDFSLVLGYVPPNSKRLFKLRRYNGKSHEHTNPIEKETFYDFHTHTATQRYQAMGPKNEEKFAEVTNAYSDIRGAMFCLIKDCNIILPDDKQLKLF